MRCFLNLIAFVKATLLPFKVICLHRISFFLWSSFTLFGGLIGIVVSIVRYTLFGEKTLAQAIYIESQNGSFYTYSIAIIASVLSGVFIIFAEKDQLRFRRYQIPLITMSIFIMFFGGIFYALSKTSVVGINVPQTTEIVLEWKQFIILIVSVLFAIYAFCVCRLDDHIDAFKDIADKANTANPEPPTTNIKN